jgi:CDP-4-dehydro-6-deoxyglucose reductase
MTATITLANQRTFLAERGISVLDAAMASNLVLEHGCRTGRCGGCKAQVTAGESAVLRDEVSLKPEEAAKGWILTCAREAVSDLALDIEDLGPLAAMASKTVPCRIQALERLATDVMKVTLRLPPNAGFAFLPGQYIDVTGPGGVKRSYSIASDARQPGRIELHVRAVEGGAMSRYWFHDAKPDDLLRLRGPLGTFFLRQVAGLHLVLLATGTGIAPMLSLLASLPHLPEAERPASVSLYWGGRQPGDLYLADLPTRAPGLRYVPVLSRAAASRAEHGHVQHAFLRSAPDLAACAVYACGSQAMTESARATLVAAGLGPQRFHADAFVSSN